MMTPSEKTPCHPNVADQLSFFHADIHTHLNQLLTGDGLIRRGQFGHLSHIIRGKFPKPLHNGIQQQFPCASLGEQIKSV